MNILEMRNGFSLGKFQTVNRSLVASSLSVGKVSHDAWVLCIVLI